jgi:6-phosphogluconolactonase
VNIEVHESEVAVARAAARMIADEATRAVAERGRFVIALSGGKTPWAMLRALVKHESVPWKSVHVLQVDERIAPPGDPDRNWTHLQAALERAPIPASQLHPMPVEEPDLALAVRRYERTLDEIAGIPPVIDLVHLGLGADGHTASLVPGDPILNLTDDDVGITGLYQERRRMTLTYPVINGARRILWVTAGPDKAGALSRLCRGDRSIPAGSVSQDHAVVITDTAAAAKLEQLT